MGDNPDAADNRWLREAMENQVKIIYFLGVSPGRYQAFWPAFIVGWDPASLKAKLAFSDERISAPGMSDVASQIVIPDRRYALRMVKQRLHQNSFREAVIAAYKGRCAISNMPEQRLLDAAHIIEDRNLELGQPIVSNGIPLSKIHHAAFDAHLIGIDPDFRLHVSDRLMSQNDGPMLDALKGLRGGKLRLPDRLRDYPDKDRLAARFEQFQALT